MKKWYFSNNGEISGPMDLASARKLVAKNSNLYGWHPSFITWKPVSVIGEFTDLIKEDKAVDQVPKEIINEFNNIKLALTEKLDLVIESIKETELLKANFKKKISLYKHLTENLSDEVQSAIVSIEQQYSAFSKRLLHLQDAATIATNEIEQVTEKFKEQISNKDVQENIEMPANTGRKISTTVEHAQSHQQNAEMADSSEVETDVDFDLVDETVSLTGKDAVQENVADESATKEIKKISTETKITKPESQSKAKKRIIIDTKASDGFHQSHRISTQEHSEAAIKTKALDVEDNSQLQNENVSASKITSINTSESTAKNGLSGVKGIFKSVFKGNEPAPKLSAQLKMAETTKDTNTKTIHTPANDEQVETVEFKTAVNESEVQSSDEDDKKAHRRRRRR